MFTPSLCNRDVICPLTHHPVRHCTSLCLIYLIHQVGHSNFSFSGQKGVPAHKSLPDSSGGNQSDWKTQYCFPQKISNYVTDCFIKYLIRLEICSNLQAGGSVPNKESALALLLFGNPVYKYSNISLFTSALEDQTLWTCLLKSALRSVWLGINIGLISIWWLLFRSPGTPFLQHALNAAQMWNSVLPGKVTLSEQDPNLFQGPCSNSWHSVALTLFWQWLC